MMPFMEPKRTGAVGASGRNHRAAVAAQTRLPVLGAGRTFQGFAAKLVADRSFLKLGIDATGGRELTAAEVTALLKVPSVKREPAAFIDVLLNDDDLLLNLRNQDATIALIRGLHELKVDSNTIQTLIVPLAGGYLTSPLANYLLEIANGQNPQGPVSTRAPLDTVLKNSGMESVFTIELS
jgi:hypothetical protein